MQLGAEGVFVGSASSRARTWRAWPTRISVATTFFDDAKKIAEVSKGLGAPMRGIALGDPGAGERLAVRGW